MRLKIQKYTNNMQKNVLLIKFKLKNKVLSEKKIQFNIIF